MGLLDYTQECLDAAEGKLPKDERGKRPIRLQVFKNQFIEKWFAQAHPITPGVWFGWIVVYGLYVGFTTLPWWQSIAAFVLGALIVTFIEYSLHRWAFHFTPKNKKERFRLFLLHGYHHDFPNDPMRLVMPPSVSVPLSLLFYGLFHVTVGAQAAPALGVGFFVWIVRAGTSEHADRLALLPLEQDEQSSSQE